MRDKLIFCFVFIFTIKTFAKEIPLVTNIFSRDIFSLNGSWNYIIDPLENGYYDYRLQPHEKNGFFQNREAKTPQDLVEYSFNLSPKINVPGDWNTQVERLFFYEGTVWYKKDFPLTKKTNHKVILYFGAVNYEAKVYVNGKKVGEHIGGYTPFNFDITDVVNEGSNFVVVKVDNKRSRDGVPTVNMDWWNYGGITRDVLIAQVPETYIEDYLIQLNNDNPNLISGWIKLNNPAEGQSINFEIPELKIKRSLKTDSEGKVHFEIQARPTFWSFDNPKLYDLSISYSGNKVTDQIGFRTIKTKGKEILLNNKSVFLRGICIHEEAPFRGGRAWSDEDAKIILTWAKELGCNFVRLAHYPHNENMIREAERMGILVWEEIPVYWTINWSNPDTYRNAENQLYEVIYRDKNRCAIIIWSIANETPLSPERDLFLKNLASFARSQDNTRLISMAMDVEHLPNNINRVKDEMSKYVDVISFNQYMGWYDGRGSMEDCRITKWEVPYNKPIIVSEWGGGAIQGMHGDKSERWTEEYLEELYIRNIEMIDKIDGFAGTTPWLLTDFLSPRRLLPGTQDYYNRKGVISDRGIKKKAFYILRDYYNQKK